MLSNILLKNLELLNKKNPANSEEINTVEKNLGIFLPQDYKDFLLYSNGITGSLSDDSFIQLWEIEKIPSRNEQIDYLADLSGLLVIGSDGGEMQYVLDLREGKKRYLMIDPLDLNNGVFFAGNNFEEFIEAVKSNNFQKITL